MSGGGQCPVLDVLSKVPGKWKSSSYVRHLTAENDTMKLPGLCVEESAGGNAESTVSHQMDLAGKYWIMIGSLCSWRKNKHHGVFRSWLFPIAGSHHVAEQTACRTNSMPPCTDACACQDGENSQNPCSIRQFTDDEDTAWRCISVKTSLETRCVMFKYGEHIPVLTYNN